MGLLILVILFVWVFYVVCLFVNLQIGMERYFKFFFCCSVPALTTNFPRKEQG